MAGSTLVTASRDGTLAEQVSEMRSQTKEGQQPAVPDLPPPEPAVRNGPAEPTEEALPAAEMIAAAATIEASAVEATAGEAPPVAEAAAAAATEESAPRKASLALANASLSGELAEKLQMQALPAAEATSAAATIETSAVEATAGEAPRAAEAAAAPATEASAPRKASLALANASLSGELAEKLQMQAEPGNAARVPEIIVSPVPADTTLEAWAETPQDRPPTPASNAEDIRKVQGAIFELRTENSSLRAHMQDMGKELDYLKRENSMLSRLEASS